MDRSELISQIVEDFSSFKRVLMVSRAKRVGKRGPTPSQIGILMLVAFEGPQHLKTLADHSCMSSSAATQLVNGLVKDHLLTRTEDAKDRRRVRLTLTAKGKRQLAQAKKTRLASFAKLLMPLSETELLEWKRLQRKIIEHA